MESGTGKLKLPENYWSERANKPTATPKTTPILPQVKTPFLDPAHKSLVISTFLIVMYFSSTATWFSALAIDKGLTVAGQSIADLFALRTFSQIQQQFAPPPPPADYSALEIITDPLLRTLVTFPGGRRAGEDITGTTFREVTTASTSETNVIVEQAVPQLSQKIHEVELTVPRPENGQYTITLASPQTGKYHYKLQLTDSTGTYTKTFENTVRLNANEPINYQLLYQKDNVKRTVFTQKENVIRRLLHLVGQ